MATELKQIIEINAAEGLRTLKDLRNNINEYRGALAELDKRMQEYRQQMESLEEGTEAYAKAQEKLTSTQEDFETVARAVAKAQDQVNSVMVASKKYVEAEKGSMNDLLATLRQQKEAWKALGDEQKDARDKLTVEINETKKKINDLNEGIGNFQHNVGNYSNSIIDAFTKMGLASTALDPHLKKVGVDISSVTNYIKIMQVTVNQFSFKGIIAGFNSATVSVKNFISGLSGIQKALIATGIGAFIVLLGALIAHWSDLNTWLGRVTDSQHAFTVELNKTTGAINSLSLRIAEFNKDQEAIERERKKLFEGWTDVDFAAEEVKKAQKLQKEAVDTLNKAAAEKEEAGRRLQEAQDKYDSAIDAEAKQLYEQDIADRLANWTKAANNFNEAARQVGEAGRAVKNMEQNLANVTKAAEDAADKTDKFGTAAKQAAEDARKALEKLQQQAQGILAELEQAALTPLEKVQAAYDKDKDTLQRAYNEGLMSYEDYEKGLLLLQDRYSKQRSDIIDADIKAAKDKADAAQKERQEAAEKAHREELADIERRRAETTGSQSDEPSLWDLDARFAQYDADLEAYRTYIEDKIAANTKLMEQYSADSEEYKRLDKENSDLRISLINKEREVQEKKSADEKKLSKLKQATVKQEVSMTTGLLRDLSSAMGESTKLGKGFAIAAATIDTIASAVAGFRAGMNQWADAGPMAWMAPVQAALNATAALVAGYAQVQKINSVDTSGNATAGGGGATALAMPNIEGLSSPVDYTRQVTTETEREELNRDNRVYILESDIQASNNRVRVREEETTF